MLHRLATTCDPTTGAIVAQIDYAITMPDGYTQVTWAQAVHDDRVSAVNAEAQRRIYGAYPDTTQRNLLAYGLSLTQMQAAGQALTAQQLADVQAMQSIWSWISSVRAASNLMTADLDSALAASPPDLAAMFGIEADTDPRWPASAPPAVPAAV